MKLTGVVNDKRECVAEEGRELDGGAGGREEAHALDAGRSAEKLSTSVGDGDGPFGWATFLVFITLRPLKAPSVAVCTIFVRRSPGVAGRSRAIAKWWLDAKAIIKDIRRKKCHLMLNKSTS